MVVRARELLEGDDGLLRSSRRALLLFIPLLLLLALFFLVGVLQGSGWALAFLLSANAKRSLLLRLLNKGSSDSAPLVSVVPSDLLSIPSSFNNLNSTGKENGNE